jgi:2-C-methyl-D-erythritol 2,4-cyclodiphosphate synthase
LALGDIGHHFPDSDPYYRGIASMKLLARVMELIYDRAYRLHNLDAVIIAQKPRLAAYMPAIRRNVADLLSTDLGSISVKAKTAESLGALGRGEGIAVHTVCLITQDDR